jgi:hypothetical protein
MLLGSSCGTKGTKGATGATCATGWTAAAVLFLEAVKE